MEIYCKSTEEKYNVDVDALLKSIAYDASNPNKYVDYWCQQDNIKNSLAYQLQFDPAVDNGGQNNDRSIDNSSQENIRKQQCEIIRLSRMSLPVQ